MFRLSGNYPPFIKYWHPTTTFPRFHRFISRKILKTLNGRQEAISPIILRSIGNPSQLIFTRFQRTCPRKLCHNSHHFAPNPSKYFHKLKKMAKRKRSWDLEIQGSIFLLFYIVIDLHPRDRSQRGSQPWFMELLHRQRTLADSKDELTKGRKAAKPLKLLQI